MEIKIEKEENKEYGKYSNFEIESLARSFLRVEEAKKDPKKWGYVEKCLAEERDEKKSQIKSIDDLLRVGESKRMEDTKEDKD